MKRKIFIFLALLLCGTMLLTSCVIAGRDIDISFGTTSYRYDDSNRYSVGDVTVTDTVTALDISWISGEVIVGYHDGEGVIVTEKSTDLLDDQEKLHYYLDGTTLRIKYMESGIYKNIHTDKTLTVKLPASIETSSVYASIPPFSFSDLSDVDIETVSADVKLMAIQTHDMDIESVSGNVELSHVSVTDSADISSVSGNVTGTLSTDELSTQNVSGRIELSLPAVQDISAESVSGNVTLSMNQTPEDMDIETVSGEVAIHLPRDAEFSVRFESASGDLESEFSMTVKGKTYTCGNSSREYDVDTVSGDVKISYGEEAVYD